MPGVTIETLREARLDSGMSREAWAVKCRVSPKLIRAIEEGDLSRCRSFFGSTLQRLSAGYGIPIDELRRLFKGDTAAVEAK